MPTVYNECGSDTREKIYQLPLFLLGQESCSSPKPVLCRGTPLSHIFIAGGLFGSRSFNDTLDMRPVSPHQIVFKDCRFFHSLSAIKARLEERLKCLYCGLLSRILKPFRETPLNSPPLLLEEKVFEKKETALQLFLRGTGRVH